MTKYLPHASIAAFMAIIIQGLQYVQTNLPAWEAAVGASILPASIGIVTTVQQVIQARTVTPKNVADIQADVQKLEDGIAALKKKTGQ